MRNLHQIRFNTKVVAGGIYSNMQQIMIGISMITEISMAGKRMKNMWKRLCTIYLVMK